MGRCSFVAHAPAAPGGPFLVFASESLRKSLMERTRSLRLFFETNDYLTSPSPDFKEEPLQPNFPRFQSQHPFELPAGVGVAVGAASSRGHRLQLGCRQ